MQPLYLLDQSHANVETDRLKKITYQFTFEHFRSGMLALSDSDQTFTLQCMNNWEKILKGNVLEALKTSKYHRGRNTIDNMINKNTELKDMAVFST